jgi:hypothetical protein
MQQSRLPITEGIPEVFGEMHEAHYGRQSNYHPSHKNGRCNIMDAPSRQIWSKNTF